MLAVVFVHILSCKLVFHHLTCIHTRSISSNISIVADVRCCHCLSYRHLRMQEFLYFITADEQWTLESSKMGVWVCALEWMNSVCVCVCVCVCVWCVCVCVCVCETSAHMPCNFWSPEYCNHYTVFTAKQSLWVCWIIQLFWLVSTVDKLLSAVQSIMRIESKLFMFSFFFSQVLFS